MEKSIEITKNERVFSLPAHFLSEFRRPQAHFPFAKRGKCPASAYFIVYAAQFLSYSLWQKRPPPEAIPVGSTFNIQNSIPHKSQKTKVAGEASRAKEFQRGTAGVPESVKEGATGLHEGSDIGLGPSGRRFEPCHSDQRPQERCSWGLIHCLLRCRI